MPTTYRSESYTGMWPMGVHWSPGEVRTIPEGYPGADTTHPDGLVLDGPAPARGPAPTKSKKETRA